jgi:hypothetical protein
MMNMFYDTPAGFFSRKDAKTQRRKELILVITSNKLPVGNSVNNLLFAIN